MFSVQLFCDPDKDLNFDMFPSTECDERKKPVKRNYFLFKTKNNKTDV
jgi:hypothetical protein